MSVTFNEIPANYKVPGTVVEVDSTKAQKSSGKKPRKVLMVGQRLSTGTIAQKVKKALRSVENARTWFGAGSMLHGMAIAYFAQRLRLDDIDVIALDDNGAGAAATLTLT